MIRTLPQLSDELGIELLDLYMMLAGRARLYSHHTIAKRDGSPRYVASPLPLTRIAQNWSLERLKLMGTKQSHSAATAFVTGGSIVAHAMPHVGKSIVVTMDIRDFYHSIRYPRVCRVFEQCDMSSEMAECVGYLCTDRAADSRACIDRWLPQGGITSPVLSNCVAYNLDRRLYGLAARYRIAYTRYADDMTFSFKSADNRKVSGVIGTIKTIIRDEGFSINEKKTRIYRQGDIARITGLILDNGRLDVPDAVKNAAILESSIAPDSARYRGLIAFIRMVYSRQIRDVEVSQ